MHFVVPLNGRNDRTTTREHVSREKKRTGEDRDMLGGKAISASFRGNREKKSLSAAR